jgi:ABC-type uncharacterized transport system ATPase subunit
MIKWIPQRFKYTRELEDGVCELNNAVRMLEVIQNGQNGIIGEYQEMQVKYNKLTLDEAETLFAAVVDYHTALKKVAADPVQNRILPIMEKYGITVERNKAVDNLRDGFEQRLKEKQSANNG